MLDYGVRILILSAVISIFDGYAVCSSRCGSIPGAADQGCRLRHEVLCGGPRGRAADHPRPRQAVQVNWPTQRQALKSMQTRSDVDAETARAAGFAWVSAVAKVSHDLRNILTTAQLFADRIENSPGPGCVSHGAEADEFHRASGQSLRAHAGLRQGGRTAAPALSVMIDLSSMWRRTSSKASGWRIEQAVS